MKAVLFDLDDTLFDRKAAQMACLNYLIEDYDSLFKNVTTDKLRQAWLDSDELTTLEFNAGAFDRTSRSRHFLKLLKLPANYTDELTLHYLKVYPSLNLPVAGAVTLIKALVVRFNAVKNTLALP